MLAPAVHRGGLAAVVAVATLVAASASAPAGGDRDCSDFDNQRQAQNFFENHNPSADPHGLDADNDGVACESLPCPCGSRGGGGGGGGGADLTDRATVKSVTDGDTIKVRDDGRTKDVRLIGIDTPEVFFGEECGGQEASNSMKRMLDPGERVTMIRDPTQDRRDGFGRLLRYIEDNDVDVGRRQVAKGWAKVFVFERPFRRVEKYRDARDRARSRDRGVWGQCGGNFHKPL